MRVRRCVTAALALTAALVLPTGAIAAYPGSNGVLAFSDYNSCQESGRLLTVLPVGRGLMPLGPDGCSEGEGTVWRPAWSGDGSQLLVTYALNDDEPPAERLALMNADGSIARVLPYASDDADLARDGRRIAFTRDGGTRDATIWTVGADGAGARRLRRGVHPRWSPDGRTIAFIAPTRTRDDGSWARGGEISLMGARSESSSTASDPASRGDGAAGSARPNHWTGHPTGDACCTRASPRSSSHRSISTSSGSTAATAGG